MQKRPDTQYIRHGIDLSTARDCIHLMLLEYGDVHIETLGQLLKMTNNAEVEYSHICCRRLRA